MTEYTSGQTKPHEIALRVGDLEAVVKGLRDTPPAPVEPIDLTALVAKLNRLYTITLQGAQSSLSSSDPAAPTIFDDVNGSLHYSVFGISEEVRDYLIAGGKPLFELLMTATDTRWIGSASNIADIVMGRSDGDYDFASPIIAHAEGSLARTVFGSPEMLTAIAEEPFFGLSFADRVFGSPSDISETPIQAQIVTMQGDITSITSDVTTMQADIDGMKSDISYLFDVVETGSGGGGDGGHDYGPEISSLTDRVTALEFEVSMPDGGDDSAEISALTGRVELLEGVVNDLLSQVADLSNRVNDLEVAG
ncbi:hypothetical protein LJR098_001101 [Rhizobium sp. LjRoot98]|uniref:hypothetical protein n=1 Tax=Rhizobium sp. LjRoot98 TaxID=3342345 RepID=UPI003ED08C0F